MEELIHRNKIIDFECTTGTVHGNNKYSETHIFSSGGGGGPVGADGGYIQAPSVRSTTTIRHEFSLKSDTGNEKNIKLSGVDVQLHPGQRITLIDAGIKGGSDRYYVIAINHSTGIISHLASAKELNSTLKIDSITGKSLAMSAAVFLGIIYFTSPQGYNGKILSEGSWSLAAATALGLLLYRALIKTIRIHNFEKRLSRHMENVAEKFRNDRLGPNPLSK